MPSDKTHTLLILFALWLLVFAASSQIMIIAPILPVIGAQLSIPEALQGTLVSAYGIFLGIFALIIGPISDRIGRRRVLLIGAGSMAVSLLLHAAAVDYLTLMILRALAGASGGLLSGAAVSYVGDFFPYERRGWANGWVMSGVAFGQIIGIPLGTVLANEFGFRIPFLWFGVTMAASFVLIWAAVPQPDVALSTRPVSLRSMLHSYSELLSRRDVAAASIAFLLLFLSIALYVVYLPTWLENELGIPGNQVAMMFLVGGVASVFAGPMAGKISDTVGRKPLIITSCLGLAIVMLLTTPLTRSALMAHVLFFVAMILASMRISPFQALLTAMVEAERRGTLLALTVAIGQIGIGLGGAVAGPVYTYSGFFNSTLLAAISLVAMAVLVFVWLPEPGRAAQELDADGVEPEVVVVE